MAKKMVVKNAREFVLAQAVKSKTETKKKVSTPVVECSEELNSLIDQYNEQHAIMNTAKDAEDRLKNEILPEGMNLYRQAVSENGYVPSININGKLLLTPANRYAVNGKSESDLADFFPQEVIDNSDYFEEEIVIKVKEPITTNERELRQLIKLVGVENFNRWFDVQHKMKPTAKAHQERFTNAKIGECFEKAIEAKTLTASVTLTTK